MTTPAFRDWIESARVVPIGTILEAHGVKLTGHGNNRAGPCPKCGGEDRFGVHLGKQVFHCRGCGAKGHGSISLEEFLGGVSFLQAVENISGSPPPQEEKKPKTPRGRKPRGTFVCSYSYVDEHGSELFQVVRYRDPKSFSQRRPDPAHDGQWIENLNGVRMVPYCLPDLLEGIANERPVYIVEGEKDADTGANMHLVATTGAMGTAGKGFWQRGAYDQFFRGADVILMPDQDDDEKKGRELMRVIGHRLKPIAARVRVLNLPNAKDLTAWVEAGGTRDDLDVLPLEDFAEPEPPKANGHDANGHAPEGMSDFTQVWEMPGEPIDAKKKKPDPIVVPVVFPFPIDAAKIPPRPWLVESFLLRRHVTVLVAPPGSGKSLLTLQVAIMMATGRPWGGWNPRGTARVLVINSEDDGDEMRRRLYAARETMAHDANGQPIAGFEAEKLRDMVALADAPEDVIIARAESKTRTVARTPVVESIVKTIKDGGFDCLIVDPFAETFEGDENSNSELKWCAVLWREIARRTNCAVLLVHHTRKFADEPGSMDMARGGGALVGVARVVSTVFTMSEKEAKAFEIDPDKRHEYLRFDDAKANLSLVTFQARWFFKKTVKLPNEDEDSPADKVGALEPWKPPTAWDKLDVATARMVLIAIDAGVRDENGAPTGDLYSFSKRGNAKRWAGSVLEDHIENLDEKDAQKILNVWRDHGVIREVERQTSTSKGKVRKGLKVDMSKLPGSKISEDTIADKVRADKRQEKEKAKQPGNVVPLRPKDEQP